jgi:penicillin-binding protein 2
MDFIRPGERDDSIFWRRRFLWILLGAVGVFVILILRLWQLQVLQGETFDRLSDKNRIRLRRIPFTRGIISDRRGRVLADNRPAFRLMGVPAEILSPRETIIRLREGVSLDGRDMVGAVSRAQNGAPFRPLTLKEDLPWDEVAWVETHRLDLPGIWVEVEPRRFYPYGTIASHLLGYVGEISKDLLTRWRGRGYRVGDLVGMSGLEWMLESYLRGRDGGQQVEVDAQGRQLMVIQEVAYQPGANLVLTQEMPLQIAAEETLGDRAGAIVVGDPNTGEIFAAVSHPSFDPNLFSEGISAKAWQALMEDPLDPLQNRVIMSQYPPGSTYKIITALAGLEEGVISPTTRLYCPGYFEIGDRKFKCWKESGHGWIRLREAVVESCDVFFYQVGQKVGVDRLAKYARGFGLGRPTGFDHDTEKPL